MNSFGARFGALIKKIRGAEGLTQQALAVKAFGDEGNKARISEIENGHVPNPQQRIVDALVVALNLTERDVARCRKPQVPELPNRFAEDIGLTLELIDALAWDFVLTNPFASSTEYQAHLSKKARELGELQARIGALGETNKFISNLIEEAATHVKYGRYKAADESLRAAEEIQQEGHTIRHVQKQVQIRVARGDAALLYGDVKIAYEHFAAAGRFYDPFIPLEGAKLRLILSDRLHEHSRRYGGFGLEASARLLKNNLRIYSREREPLGWAETQRALGKSLTYQGARVAGPLGDTLLTRALEAYETALVVYVQVGELDEWSKTANSLGNALVRKVLRVDGSNGKEFLSRAIKAFEGALSIRTRAKDPLAWAMTQNNLANALRIQGQRLGGEDGRVILSKAVNACKAALTVRTRAEYPVAWAMTQMNLGTALKRQGECTPGAAGIKLLSQAVDAYNAALAVRNQKDHPVGWAEVQWGLGIALRLKGARIGGKSGDKLLASAVTALEAAMVFFMEARQTLDGAMVAEELGLAFRAISDRIDGADKGSWLRKAVEAFDHALIHFDCESDKVRYEGCYGARKVIVDQLPNIRSTSI